MHQIYPFGYNSTSSEKFLLVVAKIIKCLVLSNRSNKVFSAVLFYAKHRCSFALLFALAQANAPSISSKTKITGLLSDGHNLHKSSNETPVQLNRSQILTEL